MKICTKCNKSLEDSMNFCPICGASLIEVTPLAKAEEEKPLAQEEPKKVGSGLKITALMFSFFGFFYSVINVFTIIANLLFHFQGGNELSSKMIFTSIFAVFPLAIVGLSLSLKAQRIDNTSKATEIGKIFALAGIILMCVALPIIMIFFQK